MQLDQSHISSAFENATEGFIITNSSAEIMMANPSACRMFGYESDQMIGQKIELLIPNKFRHQHVHLRTEFYKDPRNRVMGHGRDLYGQHSSGNSFPVEVSLSTYMHNSERYVIAFIVDISPRKKIEQSVLAQQKQLELLTAEMQNLNTELEAKVEERTVILKEALESLERSQRELSEALNKERELNEIKSRFVSMASHEFRTPLSTVLSSASLLAKYSAAEDQDKRLRHVDKIKGSVKHLNDLLEDFLSLGKLDEGKVGASYSEFVLDELVAETLEEMRAVSKKGQTILYHHGPTVMIRSDAKLVKNILINLVSNAIKFSDENCEIEVTTEVRSNELLLQVRDQGIGISDEDKMHLFSTFYRGQNALNIQGTGLGLHIVKRYLDLVSGKVSLESELNEGTSVTVRLPLNEI